MKNPPPPSRVRVTVSVASETLEVFQHLAEVQRVSVGRAMGDWLGDQLPAVTYLAIKLEEVLDAPRELSDQLAGGSTASAAAGRQPLRSVAGSPKPPRPVIRGGNSPGRGSK